MNPLKQSAVVALLLLAGCGFHLRGVGEAAQLPFSSLHVDAPAGGLGDVVQRQIGLQPGVTLTSTDRAQAVLTIVERPVEKQILAVDNSGYVAMYRLILRARFKLDVGNKERIPLTQILLHREYSFTPTTTPLGNAAEEAVLMSDMRLDAAQQIVRRMAAAKQAL